MENLERTSKEQFDKQASHYDAQWNQWSQETLDWVIESSELEPSDQVLDVATGTGFTAIAFAHKAVRVVGIDVSTGMLAEARKQAVHDGLSNVEFIEAAAEDIPFADQTFDIVSCRIAAHHFLNIDRFATESMRVLRPGGRMVIADTAVPSDDFLAAIWQNEVERLRDPSHVKNYSIQEWRRILNRAGFTVESISDRGAGIQIPLTDWIAKAGCTPERGTEVLRRFVEAPENVRKQYKIDTSSALSNFTWLRVLIKAVKSAVPILEP